MLILRAAYAPEMHSGMSRQATIRLIAPVLAALNPAGQVAAGTSSLSRQHRRRMDFRD